MFDNLDDPEILTGRLMAVAMIIFLGFVVYRALRKKPLDRVTVGAAASLTAFAWFLCWIISGGDLPFGMPALCSSILLLIGTFTLGNRRQ